MVKPLNSYLIIEPENKYLSKENLHKAVVVYAGKGHRLPLFGGFQPLTVKEGDVVVFHPGKLFSFTDLDKTYHIIREEDVILIL